MESMGSPHDRRVEDGQEPDHVTLIGNCCSFGRNCVIAHDIKFGDDVRIGDACNVAGKDVFSVKFYLVRLLSLYSTSNLNQSTY
jgi:UDP-3-O-[3-hydroxymyristoyl] glucosamine N-acyltransferase